MDVPAPDMGPSVGGPDAESKGSANTESAKNEGEQPLREEPRSSLPKSEAPKGIEEVSRPSGSEKEQPVSQAAPPEISEPREAVKGVKPQSELPRGERPPAPEVAARSEPERAPEEQASPIVQAENVGPGSGISENTPVALEAVTERQEALNRITNSGSSPESGG